MEKPLKIAIYSGEIPSTTFIERLIKGIADSGSEVLLFGAVKKKINYQPRVKVVAYKHSQMSKFWHLLKFTTLLVLFKPAEKKRLDSYLKHQKRNDLYTKVKCYPVLWYQPNVFHVQWAKGIDDWMWVQDFNIKLVLSLRGAHINYSPIANSKLAAMYRKNFPKVDGFHAVSRAIGLEAEKYAAPKENIHVVYSGLPIVKDLRTPKKENTVFKIISVGRSHWKKGYTYALDACKLLKDSGLDFHYTIVGGATDIEFAYQINDLDLSNQVTLLDRLPYNKVQYLIMNSDSLLLPSVEEGIANVVLEAMALGTLVVSTACGGMAEVVIPKQTGFLVPVRDAQAMAQALKEVSELTGEPYQNITQQARAFIGTHHNEEQMVKGMQELYESLN
uniref:glycosyltransferase family 4 protein n=1 Tax=Xanthomarina sp. F1114 TaxID=2996019 RepID=UPI00225E5391|nr:glycosyltransferase family 4 protein [Xanthomarina sp. F1114]MCX7549067.1 glycosyltransferase family 4 protein [Xanthomarina sp. F1114]